MLHPLHAQQPLEADLIQDSIKHRTPTPYKGFVGAGSPIPLSAVANGEPALS